MKKERDFENPLKPERLTVAFTKGSYTNEI